MNLRTIQRVYPEIFVPGCCFYEKNHNSGSGSRSQQCEKKNTSEFTSILHTINGKGIYTGDFEDPKRTTDENIHGATTT
jgi:hypothetical protein